MAKKKGRASARPLSPKEAFDFLDGRISESLTVRTHRALCRRLAVTRMSETETIDRLARAVDYLEGRINRNGSDQ